MKRLVLVAMLCVAACKGKARDVECSSDADCATGQVCGTDGVCETAPACPSGERMCGTVCTDITTTANCGTCGTVCTAGQSCISGTCAVPVGTTTVTAPAYADQGATGLTATATSSDAAATYTWTITGGTFADGSAAATGATVTFNASATGNAVTLEATGTNNAGEQSVGKATVSLLARLPGSIGITTAAVVTANATGIPAQVTTPLTNVTYAWSITNGALDAAAGAATTYAAGASGNVVLTVVATSLSGSTSSGMATVQIAPGILANGFTISTVPSAAVGATNLDAHVVAQSGITYGWTIAGGNFANQASSATGADVKYTAGIGPVVFLSCTGTNAAGATQTVTATVSVTLAAPSGLTATGGVNQIALSWSGVAGASKYHVLRASSAGGVMTELSDATTTSWTDSGLANGKRYFYEVEAATEGISSAATGEETAVTLLPAPQNLVATSGAAIGLSWSAVANASGYALYRQAGGSGAFLPLTTVTTVSYSDAAVTEGNEYSYVVHAVTGDAESGDSNIASGITTLDAPTGLSAAVSTYDVTLTWTGDAAAIGYEILRSTTAEGGFVVIGTSVGTTYCNCESGANPPAPATTYYYEVRGVTAFAESEESNEASATTVFTAPGDVTYQVDGRDNVTLSWSPVAGATTYGVERSLSPNGPFVEIGETNGTTYTDMNLPYGVNYYYEIVTLSDSGASPPSAVVGATTQSSAYASGSGVYGGEVQAVMFDGSGTAWAGVAGGAGIYKSTDSGATWSGAGGGLGSNAVHAIAESNGTMFAGVRGGGIYTLASGATSWSAANTGLVGTDTYSSLATDGAGTLYAASYGAIYASANNGQSWSATQFTAAAPVMGLAVSPGDAKTVYAATDGAGVFVSHDSGGTWASLGPASASCQGGVLVDPSDATHIWVGTAAGVYVSNDSGQTWSPVGSIAAVKSLAWTGGNLIASTAASGLQVSDGAGAFAAVAGSANGISTMAMNGNGAMVAGSIGGAGLFRSTDSGATWAAANVGLNAASAPAVAVAKSSPTTVYGVAGGNVVKSSDHGATWTAAMGQGIVYPVVTSAVAVDPNDARVAYVGAQGVLRTKDGGVTWKATNANFVASALALSSSTTAYAAVYNTGIYKSVNVNGDQPAWTLVSTPAMVAGMKTVVVAPSAAGTIYAGGESGIWASTDSGETWSAPGQQLMHVRSIAVDPRTSTTVYAVVGTNGGTSQVMESTDGGQTWSDVGFGTVAVQNLTTIAVDPTNGAILYALGTSSNGSVGGLYKSTNSGGAWSDVSAGLGTHELRALALDPASTGNLFVGSDDNGLFASSSGGI